MRNNLRIQLAAWLMRAMGNERHSFIAPTAEDTGINCAILEHASDNMRDDILAVLYKFLFRKNQNRLC